MGSKGGVGLGERGKRGAGVAADARVSGLASLEDRQVEELREPGFFLPAGFSLHEGGLGVICMYGNCGGNGNFTDREG